MGDEEFPSGDCSFFILNLLSGDYGKKEILYGMERG